MYVYALCIGIGVCGIVTSVLSATVDHQNTKVWGLGLESSAGLPVRYVYIQAYDAKNKMIKSDLGDDAFKMTITSSSGDIVRGRRDLLNFHNGTYIGRFRLVDYAGDIKISILHKEKHLKGSPFLVENVYGDECNCPINSKKWMKTLQCPSSYPQIDEDLEPHKIIDLSTLKEKMLKTLAITHQICHYVVKNNKIFRECFGTKQGFKMYMDAILLSMARKVKLPDIEFYLNLGDWPAEKSRDNPLPIVAWCGSTSTFDMVLPTYDITDAALQMLGRIIRDLFSVQANTGPKWKNKIEKGFFRGRDSRKERLDLAGMSMDQPDLIDAKITAYHFFRDQEAKYGKAKRIDFFQNFKYKYQINVDGTVAAYRLPYLMLGDSLVMKQDSEYYEHFYRDMKPNEHYIPLKQDLSDVAEKVKWAKRNDKEAHKIQQAGTKLAREILTPSTIFCYHMVFFKEYASRQNQNVTVLDSMEEAKHPETKCKCKDIKTKNNKKKKKQKNDEL